MQFLRSAALLLGCAALAAGAKAQTIQLPLETREGSATWNWQSQRGAPLSSTAGTPVGSDGRAPTQSAQSSAGLTLNLPTAGQFRGAYLAGSVAAPKSPQNFSASQSFALRAVNTGMPVGMSNGVVVMVMKSATVGAPLGGGQSSILFGSVIPVPSTDETGAALTVRKEDYWLAEPHSTNKHATASYYWSPNARAVFANQAGQVAVVWKKAVPSVTQPADWLSNSNAYSLEGGNYFRIYTNRYVVSGSPVKEPRRIYWTERDFSREGKPVTVPAARVNGIQVVYNSAFPVTNVTEYVEVGAAPAQGLSETRTLWFDKSQGLIHAYNREGRVMIELLGDARADGSFQHLGFEIVDVIKRPSPADVTIELGERITAWQDGRDDSNLTPNALGTATVAFRHSPSATGPAQYYALKETVNQNDLIIHWLEEGLQGIPWPVRVVRYKLVWPDSPGKYSHYVRPAAPSDAAAAATSVALPRDNVPVIAYQDDETHPRAKLTTDFRFYTLLDASMPAHRALIQYTSGQEISFERIFSWLGTTLISGSFSGTVATNLDAWNEGASRLDWADAAAAPRVLTATVSVGDRLSAPVDESQFTNGYWAGHIETSAGTSYDANAYVDPFGAGFDQANLGSIIPVNAVPGKNTLEVWWFRQNSADLLKGFKPSYWPSVLGRYSIQWPSTPREIVLASNAGSGPLDSLEAQGRIYYQNDPKKDGYNPNEEHALMVAGQAYALRDDLNITSGASYSSEPWVLVEYAGADGRPSMSVFKVLREKPEAGITFDYITTAGQILQAPMPLPLLEPPVSGSGASVINLNAEPPANSADLPAGWNPSVDPSGPYAHYSRFTFRDRKENFWVYRGFHGPPPALQAGSGAGFVAAMSGTAIVSQDFSFTVHASRREEALTLTPQAGTPLPGWLSISGMTLRGRPAAGDVLASPYRVNLTVADANDGSQVSVSLDLSVLASGTVIAQTPLQLTVNNALLGRDVTYFGRPPYLTTSPTPTNSFTMRFYYKTLAGFDWPGIASPPAVGSIVPYLRKSDGSGFIGDPTLASTAAMDVVYRPVWPALVPTLSFGDTLTSPKLGLPAIRGQTSLQLLYQQSIARDMASAKKSVTLFDPTREKVFSLSATGLKALPSGVRAESYQGKKFFPNLPPHLSQRFFFDASRGSLGQLVLRGEFKDETVGDKYLLLNVLRGQDLQAVKNLCPASDLSKSAWDQAIDNLSATLETFQADSATPGKFIKDPALDRSVGAGAIADIQSSETAVDSYALSASGPGSGYVSIIAGNGRAFTPVSEPVAIYIIKAAAPLTVGQVKVIPSPNPLSELVTLQHTLDLGGQFADYEYEWRIAPPVDGLPPAISANMAGWTLLTSSTDTPRYTLGGSGVQALADNYLVMRYRPVNSSHPLYQQWSSWTTPALAEGWIKRVLAGINPFNQRVKDLFNNRVNTEVSLLTQAGHRWEGDVALNLENINDFGLIEIYETVLRRGRSLSVDAGINYGPANDALLLAAGYLNDLYMILGNEAWADAANPTVSIGTQKGTLNDIATALFAFKGQVGSLLEEELALLRGRDDFLQPGVELAPVYNRLFWNYTRGIDAGEVIYANNYNIDENPTGTIDGVINAEDAARMYPQGHGDAYGHYLTALKGYYSLLMDTDFDWVPRTEAVTVLGQPVQVDYQDERKFAAAASAVSRAGRQVMDLTWRADYVPGHDRGWEHLAKTRENTRRATPTTRYWGFDHWAARVGQGGYLNWIVGNAILPDVDTDPNHEGIQKIDRTTVQELAEMVTTGIQIQTDMDSAEGGLSPLGLPDGAIAFDITPGQVTGASAVTHFEQILDRAKAALVNAVSSFDDTKGVTALMRSEEDTLTDFQTKVADQELSYQTDLIELYGTPYPDDVGAGKTYETGYEGPDLLHYMYVDSAELTFPNILDPAATTTYKIDVQTLPQNFQTTLYNNMDWVTGASSASYTNDPAPNGKTRYVEYQLGPLGFFGKPAAWTGKRKSPGKIQQAASALIKARTQLQSALNDAKLDKIMFDKSVDLWKYKINEKMEVRTIEGVLLGAKNLNREIQFAMDIATKVDDLTESIVSRQKKVFEKALPRILVVGAAVGGDPSSLVDAALEEADGIVETAFDSAKFIKYFISKGLDNVYSVSEDATKFFGIAPKDIELGYREDVVKLTADMAKLQSRVFAINQKLQDLDDAKRSFQALLADGDRTLAERATFRKRASATIQGYRTRDAAFRIFRNEKLERYKALFDVAAQYTYLAATAYDYETGLLNTDKGRGLINRIVSARALGVVRNNQPQFAGSDTGDPGLSSALAEMQADWQTLRGRLGFNNPDGYGTTVSLRTENLRILPSADGNQNWRDALQRARSSNLLDDPDVVRYCMQIQRADGQPVPGLILEFSTTIAEGVNLFGRSLAGGDHSFSPSSFATKLFGVGVVFEGYHGIDDPDAHTPAVGASQAVSPNDPWPFLDPLALSATPYVYLVPVGVDSMRSPPLGDSSEIRTWSVEDVTIPMPFNIGGSGYSTQPLWQSSQALSEPFFAIRKHQAFRAVSSASSKVFAPSEFGGAGALSTSQFTNRRLIGRSAWNSKWKLVIPGQTLLNDPNEGIDRFIRTVLDVKLHLVTYSYSGN